MAMEPPPERQHTMRLQRLAILFLFLVLAAVAGAVWLFAANPLLERMTAFLGAPAAQVVQAQEVRARLLQAVLNGGQAE